MYYPAVQEDNNTRSFIDTWLGYNHNYRTNSGEFYDMENLSTDAYPVMSPRKTRKLVHAIERGSVVASKDVEYILCKKDGTEFVYDEEEPEDNDIVLSDAAPEDPAEDLYWLCTKMSDKTLYKYTEGSWEKQTAYMKIYSEDAGFDDVFSEGSIVTFNTGFDAVDDGSILEKVDADYVVVKAMLYDILGVPCLKREAKATVLWKLKATEVKPGYRGILYIDSSLAYLDGDIFNYNGWQLDISEFLEDEEKGGTEEQTLLEFGNYVLIYPLNIYINLSDRANDSGRMTSKYVVEEEGVTITYSTCDINGKDYKNVVAQDTAPTSPEDGDYWLCTKEYSEGLNMWNETQSMWTPVATCYMRIEIPGANLKKYFEVDDVVSMNTRLLDINAGSQIKAIDDEYIVVIGFVYDRNGNVVLTGTQNTTDVWKLKLQQKLPKLDYVCTDKNRVWGCGYGYDSDRNFVNEIYCTKLGDFSSWFTYAGLSTDSYAVSVGSPGAWTGCISYGGYPTFFKADKIFRIYGSYPAEYTLDQIDARGVEYGSGKSLAILGEYLYYKASSGIMVFDGSLPVMISSQLGRDVSYSNGVAGANDNKYHIVMLNERGSYSYFVYDAEHGLWTKESSMAVTYFSGSVNGSMYACTSEGIYQVGVRTIEDTQSKLVNEEYVSWYATTGDMGFEYPDFKYVSRITLRAYVPKYSEVHVQISYDDRPFEDVGILRGKEETMSQTLTINPFRCDHYKLKLMGHGDVRIYSMATTLETGSEDYEYKN